MCRWLQSKFCIPRMLPTATSVNCPEGLTPSRGARGAKKKKLPVFWVQKQSQWLPEARGMLPHTRKPQNGGTATNFGQFLIFGQFLPRNNVLSVKQRQFLCCTETISVLHRDKSLCCTETKGGRPAGAGRAGAGRSRQLRPHWCPPTHPRLLSPCWGGKLQQGPMGAMGPHGVFLAGPDGAHPPQQGNSNLGWVGGHQWGLSWRDRPAPAARRPPAGSV